MPRAKPGPQTTNAPSVWDFGRAGAPILVRNAEAVTEQERRERTLQQLIETLLTIVDRRDPHAADHSARVAVVARDIALEMGLDER